MPAHLSTPSFAARAVRLVAMSALLLAGAFCALLLAVRLVAFPAIEARRDDIAQWMAKRIGQPVEIDALVTGWDGWNPKLSVRGFRVRARAPRWQRFAGLPRVDLLVAWTSLPLLDLRLKELLIEGPRLSLRRDTAGRLHLAGIEREPDEGDRRYRRRGLADAPAARSSSAMRWSRGTTNTARRRNCCSIMSRSVSSSGSAAIRPA